jgi:hypothetical protein
MSTSTLLLTSSFWSATIVSHLIWRSFAPCLSATVIPISARGSRSSSLDAMVIAAYFLQNERHKMPNFKLETVAKQYSLTVDRPGFHDALSDIRITGQILKMAELY